MEIVVGMSPSAAEELTRVYRELPSRTTMEEVQATTVALDAVDVALDAVDTEEEARPPRLREGGGGGEGSNTTARGGGTR